MQLSGLPLWIYCQPAGKPRHRCWRRLRLRLWCLRMCSAAPDPILSGQNTELSTRTRLPILSKYLPGKPRRNDSTSSALLRKVAEADYESPRGDTGVLQKNGLLPFFLVLSLLICTLAHSAGVKSMRLLMTRAPNHPKTILCRESSGSCGAWRHTRRVIPLSSPITICRTARISFAIY